MAKRKEKQNRNGKADGREGGSSYRRRTGSRNRSKKYTAEGLIEKTKRGFGFLIQEDEDIFIPRSCMNGAMDGDLVRVEYRDSDSNGKREGRVIKILQRNTTTVVGRLEKINHRGYVIPLGRHGREAVYIEKGHFAKSANGDIVEAKITRYPDEDDIPRGKVKQIIAREGAADAETLGLIRSYGIRQEFGDKAMKQARALEQDFRNRQAEGKSISPESDRRDLRELPTVTIDGAHSKDFDDAVSLEKLGDGCRLYVHIADVAEYVTEGSPLDKEALKRGNSVYLLDRVIPMLPKQLSNGICSLNPHEDRLTLTCQVDLDERGKVIDHEIYESIIRSDERLVYDDVSDLLEHGDPDLKKRYVNIYPMLLAMRDLAEVLHKRRMRNGSIDFDFSEAEIILNEEGHASDIRLVERRTANRMIEEFMLMANKVVAEHFFWTRYPFLYRVHEKPDPGKISDLRDFLRSFGIEIPSRSDAVAPKDLAAVIRRVSGTPQENVVSRVIIRTMQKADYRTECLGHFGLAFRYYTHFTSPIRRYSDLFIHRIIKDRLHSSDREFKEHQEHYKEIADGVASQVSATERNTLELEREVEKAAKVDYMSDKTGMKFDGIVSGVTANGLYVELENTVEGFVKYDTLTGFFVYDEKNYRAINEGSGVSYALGDPVQIKVAAVDTIDKLIDFEIVG